jgi:Lrp/AsnC family transcriptional regulator, leucine-responsive regulatory protein
MTLQSEGLLDAVSWKILALLQADARRSYRQIGQTIGLSAPAVAERVRRLEDAGVITGYHAAVDPKQVGLAILAQIRIGGVGDRGAEFNALVTRTTEVLECYRVTGGDSYLLKVAVRSIEHLETLIDRFVPFGDLTTALVLSTPVARRSVEPPRPPTP